MNDFSWKEYLLVLLLLMGASSLANSQQLLRPTQQTAEGRYRTVATTTDLTSATLLPALLDGEKVVVLRYNSSQSLGDMEPLVLVYSSVIGGTVDGVFLFNAPAGGNARFVKVDKTKVDVKQAGAVGNGSANDQAAIQAAITAASSAGVPVHLSGGTYLIASTLTLNNVTVTGLKSKIKSNTHITLLTVQSDVSISGIELEGAGNSGYDAAGNAISITGTSSAAYRTNVTIENCYIHGVGSYGVYSEFGERITVRNTRFQDIGYAGVALLSCRDCDVVGCRFKSMTPGTAGNSYGVAFSRNDASSNLTTFPRCTRCTVSNCLIEDNTLWEAIDTHGGDFITIDNNRIRNCKHGIIVAHSATVVPPRRVSVTNNKIDGLSNGYGIVVQGALDIAGSPYGYAEDCVVSGNIVINSGTGSVDVGGITLQGTRGCAITGNTIRDAVITGIVCYVDNQGLTITGNTIIDPHHTSIDTSCIRLRSSHQTISIAGNSFSRVNTGLDTKVGEYGIQADTSSNISLSLGQNQQNGVLFPFAGTLFANVRHGNWFAGVSHHVGSGNPNNVVTASVGSIYTDVSGAIGSTLYLKETGTGATGWNAVTSGGADNLGNHIATTTLDMQDQRIVDILDGSAASPSIQFQSTNTGLFAIANGVYTATDGVERMHVSGNGVYITDVQLRYQTGYLTTPVFVNGSEPDAGIGFPAAGDVVLYSAGAGTPAIEALRASEHTVKITNGLVAEATVLSTGDSTPSVQKAAAIRTANIGATTITAFDDAVQDQVFWLHVNDGNTTIAHNSSIALKKGSNYVATSGDVIGFFRNGTVSREIGDTSLGGAADNLGNHEATQTLHLNENAVDEVATLSFKTAVTLADGTSINVSDAGSKTTVAKIGGTTKVNTITGNPNQIVVLILDGGESIDDNTGIQLKDNADFEPTGLATITLYNDNNTSWYEIARTLLYPP